MPRSFSVLAFVLLATCSLTSSTTFTVPITNIAVGYVTKVGFGNPPKFYNVLVDTGSSNTWCGVITPYDRTSTSIPTGEAFSVTFGTGYVTGMEYLDEITLGPNLILANQSVGSANSSSGFAQFGVEGILGFGPTDLTVGTLSPDVNSTVPTVMDNLVSQGLIEEAIISFYFAPSVNDSDTNGAMTYGGTDRQLYEGDVTYVPLTDTYPSSKYWGLNITSSTYGNLTLFPNSTAGLADTGNTGVLLAVDAFNAYVNAIPGATFNLTTQLLQIPHSSVSSLRNLSFTIGGKEFTLTPDAQLFPQGQNTLLGGATGMQYGIVTSLGRLSQPGLGFILGKSFLDRYYSVFDAHAGRVGFAQTNYTFANFTL